LKLGRERRLFLIECAETGLLLFRQLSARADELEVIPLHEVMLLGR
jgi:hypothetical protein